MIKFCGALGGVALLSCWLLGIFGYAVLPSYLAAWLFWFAIPVGALTLTIGLEMAAQENAAIMGPLRRMLVLLPAGAVFALPILLRVHLLFPATHRLEHGFADFWYRPLYFIIRALVILLIWVGLAMMFARPSTARGRQFAAIAFIIHVVLATLAAEDWAMSVDPNFHSAAFALLWMASQCGIAFSVVVVLSKGKHPQAAVLGLLALLGIWMFLQFSQFLIIWSADLPREIVWYQQRSSGLGMAVEWLGFAIALLSLAVLLAPRFSYRPAPLMGVAVSLFIVHLIGTLWFITPAWRGHFSLSIADVVAMLALGGLSVAALLSTAPKQGSLRA